MKLTDYYEYCDESDPQAQRMGSEFLRPKWGKETLAMLMGDIAHILDHKREQDALLAIAERAAVQSIQLEDDEDEDDG